MTVPKLEEVYKLSGIPTHTFVKPVEYQKLIVSLRTHGRGLVIEGPSGIGKTTSISKALEELGIAKSTLKLTARKKSDIDLISALPELDKTGPVIIDDFHRLDEKIKKNIADLMKILADEEDEHSKLIIIGINKAGDSLVKFAKDLNNRIDTIKFEVNPEEKVLELIEKGENSLKIRLNVKTEIAKESHGSFHIAQMLCHEACLVGQVTEAKSEEYLIEISFETVRNRVLDELSRVFFDSARHFATGPRLRREGRAPYLQILYWLANEDDWSINFDHILPKYQSHKASVGQVIEKKLLDNFISKNPDFNDVLHYESSTKTLSIEDPKFVYFIRNISWKSFAREVGFLSMSFKSDYDFALSFAGANRNIAEKIMNKLSEREIAVFYDKNEQHRILAENVEEYLGPIYRSKAEFIIVLLGSEYPKRIWTKFESEQFKSRLSESKVIPIWFSDVPLGMFDETRKVGGFTLEIDQDIDQQVDSISETLCRKLAEVRTTNLIAE